MIHTELVKDETGCLVAYRAEGHSDYADAGYDIVCAAVSVLGCTCVNSLESLCGIRARITANDDGILAFHLPELDNPQQKHDAQLLMGHLMQGLQDVSALYPDNLKLVIKERRKSS